MNILTRLIAATMLSLPAMTAGALAQDPAPSSRLTVTFDKIAEPTGQIMFVVFDSEEAFDRGGKPVRAIVVPVDAASETTIIEGLPAGRYGIKAFHDIDSDGKMSSNPYGMPTEPFAFSNNAVGNMGPAKWADAAFDVRGAVTHSIAF